MTGDSLRWIAAMNAGLGGPMARTGHTSAIIENNLWVFGGYYRFGRNLSKLHYMNLSTLEWGEVEDAYEPEARANHSAIMISSCKWLIFGGFNGALYLNDICVLTVRERGESIRWDRCIKVSGDTPSPKQHASISLIRDKVYIFGGYSQGKTVAELHSLDISKYARESCFEWNKINVSLENSPSRRCGHCSWVAEERYLVIFGGYDNKVFSFDTKESEWIHIDVKSENQPKARRLAGSLTVPSAVFDEGESDNQFIIIGGVCDYDNRTYSDSWTFDYSTRKWTELMNEGDYYNPSILCQTLSLYYPLGHTLVASGESNNEDCVVILSFARIDNNSSVFVIAPQNSKRRSHSDSRLQSLATQYTSVSSKVNQINSGNACRVCTMCAVS